MEESCDICKHLMADPGNYKTWCALASHRGTCDDFECDEPDCENCPLMQENFCEDYEAVSR